MNFLKKFFSLAQPSSSANNANINANNANAVKAASSDALSADNTSVNNTSIKTQSVKSVSRLCLSVSLFLFPLFFLPIFTNQSDLAKQLLLIALLFVFAGRLTFSFLKTKSISIIRTPLDLPLLLFGLIYIVSIILSVNRYEAFLGGLPILLLIALYFVIVQNSVASNGNGNDARIGDVTVTAKRNGHRHHNRNLLLTPLTYSAAVIAIFALIQNLVSFAVQRSGATLLPSLAPYFSPLFSPTGSLYSQGLFLAGVFFYKIYNRYKGYNGYKSYQQIFLTGLIALGLLLTLYRLYLNPPILLPYQTGWRVAASTLGIDLKHAFFGVGPNHYLSAFTRFKDLAFNNTAFWNLRFTASSNYLFQLLTEIGIAGLFAYLFLIYKSYNFYNRCNRYLLTGFFLTQLFLPSPFIFLFLIFVLLASADDADDARMTRIKLKGLPALTYLGTLVLAIASLAYLPARYALADYYFHQSLEAIVNNQGGSAYQIQQQAIRFFPQKVDYRLAYSQTNFALANSLASQENLTDADRQTIVQLVSQAVREAKIAIQLAPNNIVALENMAAMYRGLINFAENAAVWTLASYNSAIQIDPGNPRLRLDRGGLFYQAGNFEEARNNMQTAANLKPDYTNAYYNLAKTFEQIALLSRKDNQEDKANQNYQLAIEAMQLTKNLVCNPPANQPNASIIQQDCDKANNELTALQQTASAAPTPTPTAGTSPATTPTPTGPFAPKLQEAGETGSKLPEAEITPPPVIEKESGEINL